MDAEQTTVARNCLAAAYNGSLSFPEIVGKLIAAGFEGYSVDYRRNSQTYFMQEGHVIDLPLPLPSEPVATDFDSPQIEALVRWAQSGDQGYSYAGFCARAMASGCAGYLVSFTGRRVVYYGKTAETHVELFPQ